MAVAEDAASGVDKRQYVQRIFSEIAPRYDLLNHLLSLNIDRLWRRRAIAALDWGWRPAGTYLDLCAGTLDVAAALARRAEVLEQRDTEKFVSSFVFSALAMHCGICPAGRNGVQYGTY